MPPHRSETCRPLAREPKARPVPGPIFTSRCASAPGRRDGRVIWRASGPCGRKKGGRNAPLEKREHDAYARKLDREFRKLDLQTRAERTYDTVLAPMPVRCGSVYGSRMVERCSSEVARQVETPLLSCPSTLRRTAFDYRLSANGTAAVARRSPDELRNPQDEQEITGAGSESYSSRRRRNDRGDRGNVPPLPAHSGSVHLFRSAALT